ncbi:DUF3977 family protein [Bacillus sp. CHD6a]|uniref:DUF3977 family protein n=1 Tax=Bacillus sp. CHD6a TaxID=1643452 RepID=UPI0006CDAB7F|nr:DUF3977 family protein [Bacillus sp. CHD6a]KPB06293.1 hypothetical protein AAV98_00360 [Bacillus sp. CHD6a]
MKYIELGLGNTWIIRTETELEDGTEKEERGIIGPVKFHSFYIRVWIGKTVFIFDLREGIKRVKKSRKEYKFIIGLISY